MSMEVLKEIANVSGKSGLFRILKPGRAGVIVESLSEKKEKTLIGPTAKVSVLKDVSIFTDGEADSVPIGDVFLTIREVYGEKIPFEIKPASDKDLIEFLNAVLPDFDRARVYVSDIRKIAQWYNLISSFVPEAFEAETETSAAETSEVEA